MALPNVRTALLLKRSEPCSLMQAYYPWGEMFFTDVYLRNRSLASRLRLRGINKTPYEMWTSSRPDLGHLRIIGCDASHHVPKELPGQKKFSQRAIKCLLLDFEGKNQYRRWNPVSHKVTISRDVTFDESNLLGMPTSNLH